MWRKKHAAQIALMVLVLVLAGCTPSGGTALPSADREPSGTNSSEATAVSEYTWAQLLSRDAILPVYDPEFVSADSAPYSDEELVMGVAIGDEAKAYPVGPLNSREMVNDELGGIPILVTW